jgi:hypothetical protein
VLGRKRAWEWPESPEQVMFEGPLPQSSNVDGSSGDFGEGLAAEVSSLLSVSFGPQAGAKLQAMYNSNQARKFQPTSAGSGVYPGIQEQARKFRSEEIGQVSLSCWPHMSTKRRKICSVLHLRSMFHHI